MFGYTIWWFTGGIHKIGQRGGKVIGCSTQGKGSFHQVWFLLFFYLSYLLLVSKSRLYDSFMGRIQNTSCIGWNERNRIPGSGSAWCVNSINGIISRTKKEMATEHNDRTFLSLGKTLVL